MRLTSLRSRFSRRLSAGAGTPSGPRSGNSPSTATENAGKRIQGPPNKPGQPESVPSGRVTKEGYEAGLRPDVPKKEMTASSATFSALGRLATAQAEAPGSFADAS